MSNTIEYKTKRGGKYFLIVNGEKARYNEETWPPKLTLNYDKPRGEQTEFTIADAVYKTSEAYWDKARGKKFYPYASIQEADMVNEVTRFLNEKLGS